MCKTTYLLTGIHVFEDWPISSPQAFLMPITEAAIEKIRRCIETTKEAYSKNPDVQQITFRWKEPGKWTTHDFEEIVSEDDILFWDDLDYDALPASEIVFYHDLICWPDEEFRFKSVSKYSMEEFMTPILLLDESIKKKVIR